MRFVQVLFLLCVLCKANSLNFKDFLSNSNDGQRMGRQHSISLGPCKVVINRDCPNPDIRYYLYSRAHQEIPEEISVGRDPFVSNITDSSFDPSLATKIIIHGYNSDMFLNGLVEIKKQYLIKEPLNVFALDWSPIAQGPCYPAAVWNARVAGKCAAILVQRLREMNVKDIHVIGFSLGAHVTGFLANNLVPYKLPRITGLDPAMPGFTTVNEQNKLDSSDAEFVDVIHTNAFIQGQVQESGHVDFYLNGGVIQPGCWADERFFACNHHRAPFYFAESINSEHGFWGWSCPNYFYYILGKCPPHDPQIMMGDKISKVVRGMHLVITDSVAPFAVGQFTGPTIEILRKKYQSSWNSDFERYKHELQDCTDDIDENCGINVNLSFNGFNDEIFEFALF